MQNNLDHHIQQVLALQKQQPKDKNALRSQKAFTEHQAAFFDEQASWYISEQATPEAVQQTLQHMFDAISNHAPQSKDTMILDVGSGAGVLIPFIQEAFCFPVIHALDISAKQLGNLTQRYPDIPTHQMDIVDFRSPHLFDVILCNACFGNFYSQEAALRSMSSLLTPQGIIAIMHPLGAEFVQQLHQQDPSVVPHRLPTQPERIDQLTRATHLTMAHFTHKPRYYLLILKRL